MKYIGAGGNTANVPSLSVGRGAVSLGVSSCPASGRNSSAVGRVGKVAGGGDTIGQVAMFLL